MKKAIGLLSGGLDSILASKIIYDLGFDVTAIFFYMPFLKKKPEDIPNDYFFKVENNRFKIKIIDVSLEYMNIIRNPEFGYGKNLNPCIDCKILFINKACEIMKKTGAEFIFTGEVVGQRPKSQRLSILNLIDKTCDCSGYVLRPLTGKILKETIPEQNGIINREDLFNISGRSRKQQYELAKKLGIKNFSAPAGGCLLTEKKYCNRLSEYLKINEKDKINELELLKFGRQIIKNDFKIIIGRNHQENLSIEKYCGEKDLLLRCVNEKGPTGLIQRNIYDESIDFAGRLVVRYSDAKYEEEVEVMFYNKKNDVNFTKKYIKTEMTEEDYNLFL